MDRKTVMYALNFYSDLYGDVLRNNRKTVTIRLGDKSDKYQTGMVVWVTIGPRFGRRQKLYSAILDRVEVKTIMPNSHRETLSAKIRISIARRRDRNVEPNIW